MHHGRRLALLSLTLAGAALTLTACATSAGSSPEAPATVPESAATETEEATPTPPCQLADMTVVATPAFVDVADTALYGEVNSNTSIADTRCKVPGDGEIVAWYGAHGFQIDGIGTLSDTSWFYLGTNQNCLLEVAYFADENNYSPNRMDYPEKLRFATATESLDADYAEHQERCSG